MDTVCLEDNISAVMNPTAQLIHATIKTSAAIPPRGRRNATQEKLTPSAFERQEPSIVLSVLMYSMSSQLKACRACECVCVCMVCTGMGAGIGYPSKLSLAPLPPSFSLCLIAWA